MKTSISIDGKSYELQYNINSGYYELEIEAPENGGVYEVNANFEDVFGNNYTDSKNIQVLKEKEIEKNVKTNIVYILDKTTCIVKDIKEFQETKGKYEFKIDEETNANSFINVINKPNAENLDIVYIKRKKSNYLGIVNNVSGSDNKGYKITSKYISNIFDRKIILSNEELIFETGVEDFIAETIKNEFTNSDDTLLNISYIDVEVQTHTKIKKSVETENGIYNFHTFITNCIQNYNIVMDFYYENKKIKIVIHKETEENKILLDTTTSDTTDYNEVFETDVTTKVVIKTDASIKKYFLRSDRTVTDDIEDVERAIGKVETVYTPNEEDAYQTALNIFKGNTYNHNISFRIKKDSKLFDIDKIKIGTPVLIRTKNNIILDTYISSISDKEDKFLSIICGNMRIKFIEKIKKGDSK